MRHGLAAEDPSHQEHEPQRRAFQNLARAQIPEINSHDQRDGHGGSDGEDSPRAVFQGVDHHQTDHGQKNDHDQQDRDERDEAADFPDFFPRHLAERFAVSAQRAEQDDEILDRAAKDGSDHNPESAGR